MEKVKMSIAIAPPEKPSLHAVAAAKVAPPGMAGGDPAITMLFSTALKPELETLLKSKGVKLEFVDIEDLRNAFYARFEAEDEETVLRCEGIYQQNELGVPPLIVERLTAPFTTKDGTVYPVGTLIIIDGRHRHTAARKRKMGKVLCRVVSGLSPIERSIISYYANEGGPKPNVLADLKMHVEGLTRPKEEGGPGHSFVEIRRMLAPFTIPSILRKAIAWADSNLSDNRIRKAILLVKSGKVTVDDAAKEYHLNPETLARKIDRTGKLKAPAESKAAGFPGVFKSNCQKRNKALDGQIKSFMRKWQDGEIEDETMEAILLAQEKELKWMAERAACRLKKHRDHIFNGSFGTELAEEEEREAHAGG